MVALSRDDVDTPISRRRVAKGVAWSVPALVVAASVPAFAASGCAWVTGAEYFINANTDRIILTNNGPMTVPIGTTVTWQFQNGATATRTITISGLAGLERTPPGATFSVGGGGTATVTFTTTADWASGATVRLDYSASGNTNWNFRSRLTVRLFPAPLESCAAQPVCVSVLGSTPGTTCPTVAAPSAVSPLGRSAGPAVLAPSELKDGPPRVK